MFPIIKVVHWIFLCLFVKDSSITDSHEFQYGSDMINGCVLEKAGFKLHDQHSIILQICCECLTAINVEFLLGAGKWCSLPL